MTILQISWFVQTTYFEASGIVTKKVWIGKGRFHVVFSLRDLFWGPSIVDIFHFDGLNVLVTVLAYMEFIQVGLWLMTQR